MTSKTIAPSPTSFALGFITVFLVGWVLHISSTIMIPFVIALFVWYLINAMARGLSRVNSGGFVIPRPLCFLLAILVLIGGMWFTYKIISANAQQVVAAAPQYQKKLETFIPALLASLPQAWQPSRADILSNINVGGFITELVRTFTDIAGKTLIVLFYTGFLLYEQRFFSRKLQEMIEKRETEERIQAVLRNIDIKIQRYMAVKVVISAATGILTWLWLSFFAVDFAQFWGVIAFILNFIPYVGSLVAIVLPSIITLVQFGDLSTLFIVGLGLSAIQITLGSIIDPRMMGDSLNLSPIFIIFSLAAWGLLWGVPGMFISIPILAMMVIACAQFPATRPIAIMLSKTGDIEDGEEKPKK